MTCALCQQTIWLRGWVTVRGKDLCAECADLVADALIRENSQYYQGIRRDHRRYNRVKRRLLPA